MSHASESWRPRSDSHRHITLLQSVALLFGDSAVAERTGLEPARPCGLHVSTVVAYRLADLSLAEAGGLAPPRRSRRLASNEGGLLLPNASGMFLGSPSETRTRTSSLKDSRPSLSRWGQDVVPRAGVEPALPDRESGVLSRLDERGKSFWSRGQESNLHALRQRVLKSPCIPSSNHPGRSW